MNDLRHQIESLSAAEKAELLDVVWESLEADAASLTDAQRAELDHRIERHEKNPSDVIPWEQSGQTCLRSRDVSRRLVARGVRRTARGACLVR